MLLLAFGCTSGAVIRLADTASTAAPIGTDDTGDAETIPEYLSGLTWATFFADAELRDRSGDPLGIMTDLSGVTLLGVLDWDEPRFLQASGDALGRQDLCAPTREIGGARSGEYLRTEPFDYVLGIGGYPVRVLDAELTARFDEADLWLGGVEIGGLAQMADLSPMFGGSDPNLACGYLGLAGMSCEACPDGSDTCLWLGLADLEGIPQDDAIVPVEASCDR